ncbi:MAG: recombinase RecA [Candidatus Abawacabacteria bacterium RIFCSPHIGHO2_01_FULL_46_8]|uniref:Protein RecA n=1 Tax=Candidatus Abawacabacteria bacterium RIFCSPHIGHO2_01_FULL_46_8 TaxID=1817815 RepID=A0A1F4XLU4_9BACT|nr:MAG: recombinase RecA [Candidatus Abawacabacteria bacterium RIFCSPHIGHO2_01_FULL_46_8]
MAKTKVGVKQLNNIKEAVKNEQSGSAVDLAVSQIEQRFGKGAIMRLGEQEMINVERVSTGSFALDVAVGGGYPKGRIIEIYGPESSGKTTLAMHAVAAVQRNGGIAAFIDAEHALDPAYARNIGVDVDNLLISQPDTGEQALDILETLVRANAIQIVVVDSVAALTPRAEIEGDMGDAHIGLQARLMSQALRKLAAIVSKSKTIVIFINQLRMKIGVMFGNPETTAGGNALKFYASIRLDIRRRAQIKAGEEIVGHETLVKVVKNKVAPPFRVAEFDIMYNRGICEAADVLNLALKHHLIEQAGSWFTCGELRLGQGKEGAKAFLTEHPDLIKDMKEKILIKQGITIS